MNANTTIKIKEIETLIQMLEESGNQLDRTKISQTIKFILDDLLERPNNSAKKETDSNRTNAYMPISEIITSLFVVSNYDVDDGQIFSSHLDYLQKSVEKLRLVPSFDT